MTVNFAHFPTTPTGREVTFIEQATGQCVENAEEVDTPTYLCKGDGKWYLPTGGCKCKAGYEADPEKQTCNGKFKSYIFGRSSYINEFKAYSLSLNQIDK